MIGQHVKKKKKDLDSGFVSISKRGGERKGERMREKNKRKSKRKDRAMCVSELKHLKLF